MHNAASFAHERNVCTNHIARKPRAAARDRACDARQARANTAEHARAQPAPLRARSAPREQSCQCGPIYISRAAARHALCSVKPARVCVIVIISKAGHTPRFAYAFVDTRAESPDNVEYGSRSDSAQSAVVGAGVCERLAVALAAWRVRDETRGSSSNGCRPWF